MATMPNLTAMVNVAQQKRIEQLKAEVQYISRQRDDLGAAVAEFFAAEEACDRLEDGAIARLDRADERLRIVLKNATSGDLRPFNLYIDLLVTLLGDPKVHIEVAHELVPGDNADPWVEMVPTGRMTLIVSGRRNAASEDDFDPKDYADVPGMV